MECQKHFSKVSLVEIYQKYHIRTSILPKTTESFPVSTLDIREWYLSSRLKVADPHFHVPKSIDMFERQAQPFEAYIMAVQNCPFSEKIR